MHIKYDLAGNRTNKTHNGIAVSFDLGAGNRMTNWNAVVSTNAEALLNVAGYSTEDIGTHPLYGERTVNDEDAQVSGTNFWATTVFADLSQSTQSVIAAMGDEAGNVGRDTNTWTLIVITNAAYGYDDAGNVTNIAYNTSNSILTLDWDSRYWLLSVSNGTNEVESYTYDPFGRRLTTTTDSGTIVHVYDGIHRIADLEEDGDLVRSYTYGPGVDNPLAMSMYSPTETNTYYYLTDHLGSVLALTDEDGALVESYEYDAWGRVRVFDADFEEIGASAYGNRITFQGREYAWETGLYYFRARWYDPVTGRWLSKDPIGISGGLNQYVAFENNPVMLIDPFGLDAFDDIEAGVYDSRTPAAAEAVARGANAAADAGMAGAEFAAKEAAWGFVGTGFVRWLGRAFGAIKNTLRWRGCGNLPKFVDPGDLRLPPTRPHGADPFKLQDQIRKFGRSADNMPAVQVTKGASGEMVINDGVTRATRVHTFNVIDGTRNTVPINVIETTTRDLSNLPTVANPAR